MIFIPVILIKKCRSLAAFFGAPDTNRTCDLSLRRGLLYPLSYRGVCIGILT